jgi:ankyrin repeat protein
MALKRCKHSETNYGNTSDFIHRFLWVELMLLEICSQPTDDDIREMLYKPPPTLTELYAQVLSRIDAIGRSKEATTAFKLIAVARRPLTALELQEAMAVEPFARASQPGRFINNFSQIFIWLGGLVIREEINNEVRFAHSTVLQAISDQRRIGSQQWAHIDVEQADVDVGVICTTYLHFDDFKTQLVKRSGLQNINSKTMLNASLQGTMPLLAKFLQSMPSRRISRPELSHGVANKFVDATTYGADVSGVADPGLRHHPFLEYASAHWLSHSRQFASTDRIWPFWKSLLSDDHELAKLPLDLKQNGAALSRGVVHEWHFALLLWDQLGRKLIPVDKIRSIMSTACKVRATLFLKSFFRHWAKLALNPDMITTILTEIVEMRDMDLARIVINSQFADTTMRLWNDRSNTDDSLLREHCTLIFHSATIADDVEQIKKLAMCGVNITRIVFKMNYISRGGWNPLSTAASLGNIAAVRYLLGLRVCVNTNQHLRRTALQAAAENGHVEVVRLLLFSGADINAAPTNYRGRTALQAAAGRGHTYIVELLLLAGAHVQAAPATIGGRTALQAAADSGHVEVIKLLCPSRADINAAPCKVYGRTALQAAAEGGHAKVVAKLLAKGAEVNAEPASEYGRTALQAAAGGGYAGIVTKLLLVGAHVNAKPARDGGRTALQAAAEYGDLEVVEVLLSAGANVNATTASDDGCTALRAAAQSGHAEIVKRLLSAGADPNAAPFGCTELQAAKERGHKEIVDLLLAAGAY